MATNKHNLVFWIMLILMGASLSGVGILRHAIYLLPIISIGVFFLLKPIKFDPDPNSYAFILLATIGFLSLYDYNLANFKKTYFIFSYAIVFLLFNFSRVNLDLRILALFYVLMFVITEIGGSGSSNDFSMSIINSKSSYESTLAFPLGILALFFFLTKRYFWMVILILLGTIALKRIVLLGLILSILGFLFPSILKRLFLNPISMVLMSLVLVILSIEFSLGTFDKYIFDLFDMAPNALSQGRQELWGAALTGVHYSHSSFLLFGSGMASSVIALQTAYNVDRILLHNDLLGVVIDCGYFVFAIFIYLINRVSGNKQKIMAAFVMILFFTDNVLIYQHVMITYLITQAMLRRYETSSTK